MIAVDTNILVFANRDELPLHRSAVAALLRLAEGPEAWGIPVFCIGEYLRVVSHSHLFKPPTKITDALAAISSLLKSPSARLLTPGPAYLELLGEQLKPPKQQAISSSTRRSPPSAWNMA